MVNQDEYIVINVDDDDDDKGSNESSSLSPTTNNYSEVLIGRLQLS